MLNPIPQHKLWVTPTLEEISNLIQSMPKNDRAEAYNIMMLTLNACHALVEEAHVAEGV